MDDFDYIILFLPHKGMQGPTGIKDASSGNNVISGIHDGDIMASIKDHNTREIVAKEALMSFICQVDVFANKVILDPDAIDHVRKASME